ncbi:MAG: hypothetical protein R6U19_08270 [Bacteroidales bacterium]
MRAFSCLIVLVCFLSSCVHNNSPEEIRDEVSILQDMVLKREAMLQKQIATVMELQMGESDSFINDTSDVLVQQQIDSTRKALDNFRTGIEQAEDSLDNIPELADDKRLMEASREFLSTYKSVADREYDQLIQLIALPDTAFTAEKNKAYLKTTQQLNERLDQAIKMYNQKVDKWAGK